MSEGGEGLNLKIDYESFNRIQDVSDFEKSLYDSGSDLLFGLYNSADDIAVLLKILKDNSDFNGLSGLSVLDLFSGSMSKLGKDRETIWPPYFARLCAAKGATVFGIDINGASREDLDRYYHIPADLIEVAFSEGIDRWLPLRGRTFDIIHAGNFITEPNIVFACLDRGIKSSDLKKKLEGQAPKLLKEGGVMQIEDDIYRNLGGQIKYLGNSAETSFPR